MSTRPSLRLESPRAANPDTVLASSGLSLTTPSSRIVKSEGCNASDFKIEDRNPGPRSNPQHSDPHYLRQKRQEGGLILERRGRRDCTLNPTIHAPQFSFICAATSLKVIGTSYTTTNFALAAWRERTVLGAAIAVGRTRNLFPRNRVEYETVRVDREAGVAPHRRQRRLLLASQSKKPSSIGIPRDPSRSDIQLRETRKQDHLDHRWRDLLPWVSRVRRFRRATFSAGSN
jgi:hypothetical protein